MKFVRLLTLIGTILLGIWNTYGQISPGELSKAHQFLEGVSNCTKCHDLGNKVTREKCLDCHKAIKIEIDQHRGLHATSDLLLKDCFICHNEHHGRNFKMLKFDTTNFNHSTTGFELKGSHTNKACEVCHKSAFIKDTELRKSSSTYLGLNRECLSCHEDFHKGKMAANCLNCHGFDTFKKAAGFDHNTTKFPLAGKHKTVSCEKCHISTAANRDNDSRYYGLQFTNCASCHKDVHENKFGQDCKKCHTEESFHVLKANSNFDHNNTDFKLYGKHQTVDCKKCHKTNLVAKIKSDHCFDCHVDYHQSEFQKDGVSPDCDQCHTTSGFIESTYSIEKHNLLKFSLDGAHLATPCSECHKQTEKWKFRKLGLLCHDCHTDIHQGLIQEHYYPEQECLKCHTTESWKSIKFDHSETQFKLAGAHAKTLCRKCHINKGEGDILVQKFRGLSTSCLDCHTNIHGTQFDINGKTDCQRCHSAESWNNLIFNHDSARFKLDGAHKNVKCEKCHKQITNVTEPTIEYKTNRLNCSDCHK